MKLTNKKIVFGAIALLIAGGALYQTKCQAQAEIQGSYVTDFIERGVSITDGAAQVGVGVDVVANVLRSELDRLKFHSPADVSCEAVVRVDHTGVHHARNEHIRGQRRYVPQQLDSLPSESEHHHKQRPT